MDSIHKFCAVGVWMVFGIIILVLSDNCSGATIKDDFNKGWSSSNIPSPQSSSYASASSSNFLLAENVVSTGSASDNIQIVAESSPSSMPMTISVNVNQEAPVNQQYSIGTAGAYLGSKNPVKQ